MAIVFYKIENQCVLGRPLTAKGDVKTHLHLVLSFLSSHVEEPQSKLQFDEALLLKIYRHLAWSLSCFTLDTLWFKLRVANIDDS